MEKEEQTHFPVCSGDSNDHNHFWLYVNEHCVELRSNSKRIGQIGHGVSHSIEKILVTRKTLLFL